MLQVLKPQVQVGLQVQVLETNYSTVQVPVPAIGKAHHSL